MENRLTDDAVIEKMIDGVFNDLDLDDTASRLPMLEELSAEDFKHSFIQRIKERLDSIAFEEGYCPRCLVNKAIVVTMEELEGSDEYMGDYGSAPAYQYIVTSVKCPECGHIEEY